MKIETTEDVANGLLHLYEESCHVPFPYEGSRKLLRKDNRKYEGLIPALDLYFSDIAGYCSWGKRILKWQKGKIEAAVEQLGKSFFERYPQYKQLEPMITESDTPDLYASLTAYEMMRTELLRVLSRQLAD